MKTLPLIAILIMAIFFCHAETRKNVLFIAVDDLKPVIGAFGESEIRTPHIDKLAERGVTFANAHCQFAICGPSRASIMTGMRPDVTRVWDLSTKMRNENADIITIPEYFKYNGYETLGTGKIYDPRCIDNDRDVPSWSKVFVKEWNTPQASTGEPKEYLYFYSSEETRAYAEELLAEAEDQGLTGGAAITYAHKYFKPATEAADVSDEGYVDGRLANQAIKFIDEYSGRGKPFFAAVGFKKPHLPFCAPKKYWDMYDSSDIVLEEYQEYASNGAPAEAFQNSNELRNYTGIPADTILPEAIQRELIHGYYACVSYIDALIGNILNHLEEKGLMENTIIVFWGDHGFHLGDHGMWCKHTNFEQATRSPLIISSPGSQRGIVNRSPVEFVDVFPTLNELAGLPMLDYLDGTSLIPILNGEKEKVNEAAYSQYNRNGKLKMGYTLRTERYRYTEWMDNSWRTYDEYKASNLIGVELYDYAVDEMETLNLVDKSEYNSIVDSLTEILHASFKEQIDGNKVLPVFYNALQSLRAENRVGSETDGTRSGYLINSDEKGDKQLVIHGIDSNVDSEVEVKYQGSSLGLFDISSDTDSLVIDIKLEKGKGFIEIDGLGKTVVFDAFWIRDVIETGIGKINEFNDLKVYPNPMGEILDFSGITFVEELSVMAMNGQTVFQMESVNFPVSLPTNMSSGFYLVQLRNGNENRFYKVLKN